MRVRGSVAVCFTLFVAFGARPASASPFWWDIYGHVSSVAAEAESVGAPSVGSSVHMLFGFDTESTNFCPADLQAQGGDYQITALLEMQGKSLQKGSNLEVNSPDGNCYSVVPTGGTLRTFYNQTFPFLDRTFVGFNVPWKTGDISELLNTGPSYISLLYTVPGLMFKPTASVNVDQFRLIVPEPAPLALLTLAILGLVLSAPIRSKLGSRRSRDTA